jgi:hypothetical protein
MTDTDTDTDTGTGTATGTLAVLHSLLDAGLDRHPPEYRDGLSNHLPMALQALQALGAGEARMRQFYAVYARRFEGLSPPEPAAPVDDWLALRGRPQGFATLRASFERALARDGETAVLRRVLPALLPGVAAAAFHGAIRTAHALQAGHRRELAAALAYWAWRWQPLPAPPAAAEALPFESWSARLLGEAADWRSQAPLISGRIEEAAATPCYRALGAALRPTPELLRRLSGLAAERYLAGRNFTVLHMITGLRALRVLLPLLDGRVEELQAMLVPVFTAAYLAAGVRPASAGLAPPQAPAWPAVVAAAIASDDEHVIKLVHACREEAAVYGAGPYLEVAALALG